MTNDSVVAFYTVKFNGTPDEVKAWILENDPKKLNIAHDVLVGGTGEYVTIDQYLNQVAA